MSSLYGNEDSLEAENMARVLKKLVWTEPDRGESVSIHTTKSLREPVSFKALQNIC